MKKLYFLLSISLFLISICPANAQDEYLPKNMIPFNTTDTLTQADTLTSGWQFIGDKLGSLTFGIVFDFLGDSVSDLSFKAQIKLSDMPAGVWDDSLAAGDTTGWMDIADIDSICIADSLGWYYPLSDEDWWNWIDYIRFRIISPAAHDSTMVTKCRLRGQ